MHAEIFFFTGEKEIKYGSWARINNHRLCSLLSTKIKKLCPVRYF